MFDDEDDLDEFDGPEDDESLVEAWKDVPIADLFDDIRDDLRRLA